MVIDITLKIILPLIVMIASEAALKGANEVMTCGGGIIRVSQRNKLNGVTGS